MTLEDHLDIAATTGNSYMFWGDPGIGKTSRIEAWAREKGYHLEVLTLSLYDPTEIAGLFALTGENTAERIPPGWVERILRAAAEGRRAVVFLDELNTAAQAVQNAALRLIQNKAIDNVRLPPDTIIIAAGNPPERVHGLWSLSEAMRNRFAHVNVEPDLKSWLKILPEKSQPHQLVAAFLRDQPQSFHVFPETENDQAWPSARSWSAFAEALGVVLEKEDPIAMLYQVASSYLGNAVASEFAKWYLDWLNGEGVSIDRTLANPHAAPVPAAPDTATRVVENIANRISEALEQGREDAGELLSAGLAYLARVFASGHSGAVMAATEQISESVIAAGEGVVDYAGLSDEARGLLEKVARAIAEAA